MIGAHDSSHSWTPIEKVVKADHDDCFRIEGCGVWGAVGRMCMAGYKDKAQLLGLLDTVFGIQLLGDTDGIDRYLTSAS